MTGSEELLLKNDFLLPMSMYAWTLQKS